tara:strand:- start:301 stop:438 length:138 start_codon:yes stop_codon:yes gene_type:complete
MVPDDLTKGQVWQGLSAKTPTGEKHCSKEENTFLKVKHKKILLWF